MKNYVLVFMMTICCAFQPLFAQFKSRVDIDSLKRIVDNPEVSEEAKIEPLARLSSIYTIFSDSVQAANYLNKAKEIAQKHSNDKEKIETLYADFLYNYKITQDYTTAFEDIENLQYIADSKDVIETKALAYNYIQKAKELAAFEQNEVVNDCYTAISLAEKLSESNKSRSKVLIDCYRSLLYYYYALYDDFDKINDIIYKIYDESLKANDINHQCFALNKLSALYIDKARVNDDMSLIDSAKTVIDRAEQIVNDYPNYVDSLKFSEMYFLISFILEYTNADKHTIQTFVDKVEKFSRNNPRLLDGVVMAQIYKLLGNDNLYEKYLLETSNSSKEREKPATMLLADFYEERNEWQKAAECYEKLAVYYYQEISNDRTNSIRKIEARFQVQKTKQELEFTKKRNNVIVVSAIIIVALMTALLWMFRKRAVLKQNSLELQAHIKQLEAEKARNEAVAANIHLEHQTKFMAEAQEKLKESEIDSAEIEQLFKNEKIIDKEISNFKQFISDISPQFVQLLEQKAAPGRLTNDEIKLASCVAMKMDNKQIADIFGISQDYVRTKKARLKKKLNLSYEENLSDLAGDSFQNS